LFSALLFFVPHDVWQGKATATGMAAAQYVGYPATNISAPLPAEFYSDFGIAGVVALTAAVAIGFAYCDQLLEKFRLRPVARLPLLVLAGFSGIIARGALLSIIGPVAAAVGLSSALAILLSRKNPVRSFQHAAPRFRR